MGWWARLTLKWKLQLGFILVTALTTLFNRFLAVHELQVLIEIAQDHNVDPKVVALMAEERLSFMLHSIWESALEFAIQFMVIGVVASIFVRPIRALIKALQGAVKGDLTQSVPIKSEDEIGMVSVHFNEMVSRLNDVLNNADSSALHMRQSAYQITEVSQGIATQSDEEKAKFTAVSSVIEALHQVSEQVQQLAGDSLTIAQSAKSSAESSQREVRQTVSDMEQIEQRVAQASTYLSELSHTAEEIAQIIGTIAGIAEQTNLLALNAAIEAARAGEQGRGFAVVADEVRSLAEKTSGSSNEINRIINNLTQKVLQVTESMDVVVQQVQHNATTARQTADEIGNATQEVTVAANNAQEINTLSSRQFDEFQTLTNAMADLQEALHQNTSKVSNTANIAQSLFKLTEKLHKLIGEFKINKQNILIEALPSDDRRKSPRIDSNLLVRVEIEDRWEDAYCENISEAGMKLVLSKSMDEKLPAEIEILTPEEDFEAYRNQPPVKITASIQHKEKINEGYSYGLKFINPDKDAQARISRAIHYLSGQAA